MNASSLFDLKMTVEDYFGSKNAKNCKKGEPVYLMVVRTNEDAGIAGIEETKPTNDDQIVTVNEDTTRTEYPRAGTRITYRIFRYFSKGVTCRVATRSVNWIIG